MKLLYLNNELAVADGCNAHALGMLNALKREIGEENIFTYPEPQDCSGKLDNKNVSKFKNKLSSLLQVLRFYRKSIRSVLLANELCRKMKKRQFVPTHILVRSSVFETTALIIAKRTKAKLICEMNTPFYYEWCVVRKLPLRRQVEHWEKKLLFKADYIYVVSTELKRMYIEHYGIDKKKILVIPNGFDKNLYSDWIDNYGVIRDTIRKNERIQDKFVVTFIGSLKVWHGIERFCKLADKLQLYNKIHFLVLGDGEMRFLIEDYISSHNNMTFMGKQNYQRMKEYIYASDIGIMPYIANKNFYFSPLKMYDMIGGYLPFIGTSVGQIKEVCHQLLSSDFLVENTDQAFIDRIIDIQSDDELYKGMQNIILKQHNKFTWDERAIMLLEALK